MAMSTTAVAFIIAVLAISVALGDVRDGANSSTPTTVVSNDVNYKAEKTTREPHS